MYTVITTGSRTSPKLEFSSTPVDRMETWRFSFVGFAKEYYMDGATVLIVALAIGFVFVVMFFVLEARKHAGKRMDSDN